MCSVVTRMYIADVRMLHLRSCFRHSRPHSNSHFLLFSYESQRSCVRSARRLHLVSARVARLTSHHFRYPFYIGSFHRASRSVFQPSSYSASQSLGSPSPWRGIGADGLRQAWLRHQHSDRRRVSDQEAPQCARSGGGIDVPGGTSCGDALAARIAALRCTGPLSRALPWAAPLL